MSRKLLALLMALLMTVSVLTGCGGGDGSAASSSGQETVEQADRSEAQSSQSGDASAPDRSEAEPEVKPEPKPEPNPQPAAEFSLSSVPAFSGSPYTAVNGNVPYFTDGELTDVSFEQYAPLDSLGRCGVAAASVGRDLMPTEERGGIGQVKPTGWHTVKYDVVDGKYLYNRCHLIGYQLSGENANTRNLITGTRYLNIEGMLPFENMVADYVKETGNHVMYRVTPVYEGSNLLAAGVLMEGRSVEDGGEGVSFCVFAYNAQPGVSIDYATGDSALTGGSAPQAKPEPKPEPKPAPAAPSADCTYILNTNTKKFHEPDCPSVKRMSEKNKQEFSGSRQELIDRGYEPCGNCNP